MKKLFKVALLIFLIILYNAAYSQTTNLDSFTNGKHNILRTYHISFNQENDSIRKESYPFLDSLAFLLVKKENLKIEIGVHTDTRWRDEYSKALSTRRASVIRDYTKIKSVSHIQNL